MVPHGFVACRSRSGRILLHLMKPDLSKTVCGRYLLEDILEEDNPRVNESLARCKQCQYTVDHTGPAGSHQRGCP